MPLAYSSEPIAIINYTAGHRMTPKGGPIRMSGQYSGGLLPH
jgi:hypothetical protein